MKRVLFLLLLPAVFVVQKVSARAGSDSIFVPCPVTIFEDNFRNDSAGTFPKHWWIMHRDSVRYKRLNVVRNLNGKKALVITNAGDKPGWQPLLCAIGPRMPGIDYLPGSFTLEYDFLLSNQAVMEPGFFTTNANEILKIFLHNKDISYQFLDDQDPLPHKTVQIPGFNYRAWHHFALSYHARQATCYIDSKKVFTTPALTRDVYKFLMGNWTTYHPGKDAIAYTNFRIATDTEAANFNRLLSEHTFTTHAILFDVNKANVKAESAGFIKQLAEWLKANPTVNLEIDGHTDNDGDATANMKLSQTRSDEVKKQLVSLGIESTRLTTKGYGAMKPVRPNATPGEKAENRRVEFIKR